MIYIWIRATCDWSDEQAFLEQIEPNFEDRLELWNQSFDMPYHRYRARVFEIAQANLAEVRGATVAEWDEIPEDALVMPTDDDDWFAPHAAETLERVRRPGVEAYAWEPTFVETPMWAGHRLYLARRTLLPWWRPRWTCFTNTYAMPKREANLNCLRDHVGASARVDSTTGSEVVTLPDRLSVINRTIASKTQLGAGDRGRESTKGEMLRKLSHAPWAKPYVTQMAALTEELRPRG